MEKKGIGKGGKDQRIEVQWRKESRGMEEKGKGKGGKDRRTEV